MSLHLENLAEKFEHPPQVTYWREARGFNYAQAAKELGLSLREYAMLECGIGHPDDLRCVPMRHRASLRLKA